MIVVDASAITELLLQTELGTRVEHRIYRTMLSSTRRIFLDVEVLSALRRLVQAGEVRADRTVEAVEACRCCEYFGMVTSIS